MKKLILFLLILANLSCAESAVSSPGYSKVTAGKLGSAENWQQTKNAILFNKLSEALPLFSLPQDRPENLQVEQVLSSLHTWFSEGVGYQLLTDYTYEYLLLNEIPDSVVAEIQTRMAAPSMGFAILDQKFWSDVQTYQKQGFRFAFVTHSPIVIAGFYSDEQKLIAIDLFSNSGTITHEMQHHLDHEELQPLEWWQLGYFREACANQLSVFLGEVSATTEQLLKWNDVILSRRFTANSVEEYEGQGGKMVADNFIYALQANLEYPTERGNAFMKQNTCPKFVDDIVEKIRALASKQVEEVIRYEDTLNFSMKFRVQTGENLKKAAGACVNDGSGHTSTTECLDSINTYKKLEAEASFEKMELANRINVAWEERVTEIPKILAQMSDEHFAEACETVLGFKKLAHCNVNRMIEAR